ncbi:hypothetical protein P409_18840, partial [Inquilinus limosus MP06]
AGARGPIYAALAGDLAVAATKSAAAAWTGGSAMLSEAIHSAVDPGRLMKAYPGITRVFLRPSPPSTPPGP